MKQGSRSVTDNEVHFNQLSRYAPHMVATEKKKCNRFESGLRFTIRNRITTADMVSFGQLRAASIRAEKLDIEARTFHSTKRKNNDKIGGSESKKGFNVTSRGGSYPGSKSLLGT